MSSCGYDLDYTMSLPLLLLPLWFLLYIFCCGKLFVSLWVILIHGCSVNSYNFGVPKVGGLRVILLHHLGHTLMMAGFFK